MTQLIQQIVFILVILATSVIFYKRIGFIRQAIRLGKKIPLSDQPGRRWRKVLLLAFGQKKMFRRITPAIFHLIIYLGFIIINIEVLEFIIDGVTGNHRVFAMALNPEGAYSRLYSLVLNGFEWLALGVIVACVIFLIRRNMMNIGRFRGIEMKSWPVTDANLILVFEIILMFAILTMNAADQLLQQGGMENYTATGPLYVSRFLIIPLIRGLDLQELLILERFAWWFHILGILGFAVYITYSKHLHIFLAFPNTYYSSLGSPAQIRNMEVVNREVQMMLGIQTGQEGEPAFKNGNGHEEGSASPDLERLGACDVTDLTWKNLMDAFTCSECGRCTAVCPANITGKKLSPRKIMMDTRDRAEILVRRLQGRRPGGNTGNDGANQAGNGQENLFSLIFREEIFACTTCNACIDACPLAIDPVSIIIQMRRYTTMEESTAPPEWNSMFNNIENNFAPWKFPSADRFKWAEDIRKSLP